MKKFFNRNLFSVSLSVLVSFVFIFAATQAATTISTNINTGGTLTVSGASTLTGALAVDTDTFYVDATNNRVGVGTSSPSAFFSVGGAAGTVTGDAYFTGGLTIGGAAGINSIDGSILLAAKASDPTGLTEGTFYYNSTNKVLKMYDGSSWFTMGTSTSGLTLNDPRLQLTDLNYYMTFGTTTQSGLSVMTLEATSTAAIPLTIRGYNAQEANLFIVEDVAGTDLFTIDASGRLTSNLDVNGYATTTASNGNIATEGTLDVTGLTTLTNASTTYVSASGGLWVNGNATTTSTGTLTLSTSLGVASSSPYVALGVTGTTTASAGMVIGNGSTPLNQILFGTATINPEDGPIAEATATTTTFTATGAQTGDKVLITPANLPAGLYFLSASTTADNTVQVMIGATSSTSPDITSYEGWSWMIVR